MTKQIPAERPLPDRDHVLAGILGDEGVPARRRSWLVPAAAAASIALVAGGAVVASALENTPPGQPPSTAPAAPAATSATRVDDGSIRINLRPLTAAETSKLAKECETWARGHATLVGQSVKVGKIRYAVLNREQPLVRTRRVIAFESATGLQMCEERRTKLNGRPILDFIAGGISEDGGTVRIWGSGGEIGLELAPKKSRLHDGAWMEPGPAVASIRQRYIVKGRTGPWYVSDAVNGLVRTRIWDQSTALRVGDEVRLETQWLDQDGQLLAPPPKTEALGTQVGRSRVVAGTVRPHVGDNGKTGDIIYQPLK